MTTVSKLKADLEKLQSTLKSNQRTLSQRAKSMEDVMAHCDQEIAKLQKDAGNPRSQHLQQVYRVRKQLANTSLEIVKIILAFDPTNPESAKVFMAQQPRLGTLKIEARYLATEFSVLNYKPIAEQIAAAVATGRTGTGGLRTPTGGLRTPTGQLNQQAARPGAPAQGPAQAGQGAPRPGTGRLNPQAVPPQPGQPPQQRGASGPLRPGTGPLSAQQGAARPGTGSLQQPQQATPTGQLRPTTGQLQGNQGTSTLSVIARLASDGQHRKNLELMVQQFQEIEASLAEIRGDEYGQLSVAHAAADAHLNKLAGKLYYMDRTVQQMGPAAACLAFETEATDENLEQFLSRQVVQPEATGSLSEKLKKLFK
jgi:hypothetical protein